MIEYSCYDWGRIGLTFDGITWQAWAEPYYYTAPQQQFRHVSPDKDTAFELCRADVNAWLAARTLPASPDAEAEN